MYVQGTDSMKKQSHEAKAMNDTMFTDILKGMVNQEMIGQRLYSTAKTGVMYTWTPYRGSELIRLIQEMRNVDPSMQAKIDLLLYVKLAWLDYYPFDHVQFVHCKYKIFY